MKLFVTTREKKMFYGLILLTVLAFSLWFSFLFTEKAEEAISASPEMKRISLEEEGNSLTIAPSSEPSQTSATPNGNSAQAPGEAKQLSSPVQQDKAQPLEEVVVDVKGAVQTPNVYTLKKGGRVIDAIQAAGGFNQDAVTKYINLAQLLEDGMVIYIPTEKEVTEAQDKTAQHWQSSSIVTPGQQATGSTQASASAEGRININTATAGELEKLPGIGASRAQAIIKYRNEKGAFQKKEDLMKISGIGSKLFEQIKDLIDL